MVPKSCSSVANSIAGSGPSGLVSGVAAVVCGPVGTPEPFPSSSAIRLSSCAIRFSASLSRHDTITRSERDNNASPTRFLIVQFVLLYFVNSPLILFSPNLFQQFVDIFEQSLILFPRLVQYLLAFRLTLRSLRFLTSAYRISDPRLRYFPVFVQLIRYLFPWTGLLSVCKQHSDSSSGCQHRQ